MKVLQNILDFIMSSSIWVAFSVCALVQITTINLKIDTDHTLSFFVFFSTVSGYNVIKYYELFYLKKASFRGFKLLLGITVISMVLSFILFVNLKNSTQLFFLLPCVLAAFYVFPIFSKTLRTLPRVKIYSIALCWSLVTVVLPVIQNNDGFSAVIFAETVQRFLFIVVLTLPFELRDLGEDEASLRTIPQRYGVVTTKKIGLGLLLGCFVIMLLKDTNTLLHFVIEAGVLFFTGVLLMMSKQKQSKYFSGFIVEGIPVFWFLLLLVFT